MNTILNAPFGQVLGWCWSSLWRGFIWVAVYNLTAYGFGIETSWWLFGLCIITGLADRILYWPDSPARRDGATS
jgi:hypothetical protein